MLMTGPVNPCQELWCTLRLGGGLDYITNLTDPHARCQPVIFISIWAPVALMFLAGKQSLSCGVWRAKPPN